MTAEYDFHCNGRTYRMNNPLTVEEVHLIWKMRKENAAKFADIHKELQRYCEFCESNEDFWGLIKATLKKCMVLTDEQIDKMNYQEAFSIFNGILAFCNNATKAK